MSYVYFYGLVCLFIIYESSLLSSRLTLLEYVLELIASHALPFIKVVQCKIGHTYPIGAETAEWSYTAEEELVVVFCETPSEK